MGALYTKKIILNNTITKQDMDIYKQLPSQLPPVDKDMS